MTADAASYLAALDELHNPSMTMIEKGLRSCWELRTDLHGKVLTGNEMAEYMLCMLESESRGPTMEQIVVPAMLQGGGISGIGQTLLRNSKDTDARKALTALYNSPQEVDFFLDGQDISAGVFLRYLPAYWRRDEYFEVYYVFSGSCQVFFTREVLTLKPGSVLIVPPDTQKACTCLADDSMVYFFMIRKSTFSHVFWSQLSSQNLMAHFFRQSLTGEGHASYLRFETGQDTGIELLLYAIYQEYHNNQKYSAQLINSLMSSFFLCLLQRHEDTAQVSRSSGFSWKPEFAEILEDIQNNYQTVTLGALSEKYGYSRRQLIRIIQNCTGRNFTELQTSLRMEKASLILAARTASAGDVALEIGFADFSSFCRTFKKYFGCTPGEYMKSR